MIMDFTIGRGDFLKELQLVQGIVERKSTIPILANLLMSARSDGVRLAATDMDVGVETLCGAEVTTEGAITLNARRLMEIVRKLPEAPVRLYLDDETWVRIECQTIQYRIAGQPERDFPTLGEHDFSDAVELDGGDLRAMIEKVLFAITTDDPRYSLNGALLQVDGGRLTLVATDGHRLALVSRPAAEAKAEGLKVIVPRKTLSELQKLAEGQEKVRFGQKANQMFFQAGQRLLQSNTLEGKFPNYEKVLPPGNDIEVLLPTMALSSALERVSLLSTDRTRAVRLALKEGEVELSSSSPEIGEAHEVLPSSHEGQDMVICFNARYLLDMLGVVGTEQVVLALKDEQTQGLLRPLYPEEDKAAEDYRYVVMPMRLS
jgi:DNA polymerase-3 subunit beta